MVAPALAVGEIVHWSNLTDEAECLVIEQPKFIVFRFKTLNFVGEIYKMLTPPSPVVLSVGDLKGLWTMSVASFKLFSGWYPKPIYQTLGHRSQKEEKGFSLPGPTFALRIDSYSSWCSWSIWNTRKRCLFNGNLGWVYVLCGEFTNIICLVIHCSHWKDF